VTRYTLSFEHVQRVEMSFEGLWRGLEDFVRHAENYIEPLQACRILEERDEDGGRLIRRRLDFGNFAFEDRVLMTFGRNLMISAPALGELPASLFEVHTKPLGPSVQELRFAYREGEGVTLPENLKTLRQQAWQDKDCRLIQRIQEEFGAGKAKGLG